ncbi:MAG TPA: Wzt carbohydrate-binding domain-containing protein [Acidimicrobiales bacterium]|nr:Wzt carbohydrate-binding domain-containing protein [Acidimicrobiales bacterium]
MLKCLTKILRPNQGTVKVNGKVSALLELGAGFHQELSGRENIFLNGAILGLSQKELKSRFDEIVDFAGVGEFIDEPVKNYSSGMYVRLGFSVAINVDPDVLLVDEVLAVGDESFQRKCNEKFAEMRGQGKTIILVSHGLDIVQNLCDRAAWFSHGRLMKVSDPKTVIDAYTDTVEVDRRVDTGGNTRWGSGEGRIERVEWVDDHGQPTRLHTGRPAHLRLTYELSQAIARPVFNMRIRTLDGFEVSGPSAKDLDCVPDKLEGSGHVHIHFDRLALLPGTYDLSVSLSDYARLHLFDLRRDVLRFDVERGDFHEQSGVAALDGAWTIEPL